MSFESWLRKEGFETTPPHCEHDENAQAVRDFLCDIAKQCEEAHLEELFTPEQLAEWREKGYSDEDLRKMVQEAGNRLMGANLMTEGNPIEPETN